jgi:hypothetical protein
VDIEQPKHEFPVRRVELEVASVGGVDVPRHGTGAMHWLDNDRLAVLGLVWEVPPRPFKVKDPDPRPRYDTYLYVWDVRTPQPRQVLKIPDSRAQLFGDGLTLRIFFRREGEKRSEILEGTIVDDRFEGKSMPFPGEAGEFVANRFTGVLSRTSDAPPAAPGGRVIRALRPEHGFLDLGGDDDAHWEAPEKDPVAWHPAGGGIPQKLPIWFRNPKQYPLTYSGYTGEYLFSDRTGRNDRRGYSTNWVRGDSQVIFLWKPGNDPTRIEVPDADYVPIRHALPSKKGLVIISELARLTKDLRGAGVHIFDGKGSRHLAAGSPNAYALSPDGCRLAVGLQTTEGRVLQPWRLHLIDLCSEGTWSVSFRPARTSPAPCEEGKASPPPPIDPVSRRASMR